MSAALQVYPHAGEEIGPFRITRRLGGGGMGVVYAAKQGGLDRDVALKVISPHLADNRDFRVRFAREARAMAALDSGNVVHVYTFGEDRGRLYIASQLIPDGDLDSMLHERGAPPLGLALELMAQVTGGLADAHVAGVVHRDIKPANVLLRERPDGFTAYLGDFGIAGTADAAPGTSSHAVGTSLYMAPELHLGAPAGVSSDIYAMGCLLWATLSGWPPYAGTTDFQIVSAHFDSPVPRIMGDSPQTQCVNRILEIAMAKDPSQRHPTAIALRDDLRYALSLPGPSAYVAMPAPPQPPRRRRGRAGTLVAALAAALVVGIGGAVSAGIAMRDNDSAGAARASLPPQTSSSDQRRAVANIAHAFESQLFVGPTRARCIAEGWIDEVGLDSLVDVGFLDEQMNFYDQDLDTVDTRIGDALTAATSECMS